MNSTSSSNVLLSVRDIIFSYYMDIYKTNSVRDNFIKYLKDPLGCLLKKKDVLCVLDQVSFEVKRGDRIGVIGVNGTGKTTLCRCLAKILTPQYGKITSFGRVRAIFNTSIGIIPELTGRENAELLSVFLYPELKEKERRNLIDEALSFSELDAFLDAPYYTYSKGMQARLSLSLISARPCDLLILDEVFDGADEFFQSKISQRFINIIEKSGAVIFVSHTAEQIRLTCNRVIVLNHKKIAFDGDVEAGISYYRKINNHMHKLV